MNEIIAYCGLPCHSCGIFLATKEDNEEKKHKMRIEIAQQIKEHYGRECRPEDITDCYGCKAENDRLFSESRNCQIRKCAIEKGVENCAHCDKYVCENLEKFFKTDPSAREQLDKIKNKL